MANKKHWWQEQPLTISAIQCTHDDSFWAMDNYVSKYGFNTEQLLHLWGDKESWICAFDNERDRENLKKYLDIAHKNGIREIVYFNIHALNHDVVAEHPDWQQIKKDGSTFNLYDLYAATCVNTKGGFHKNFLKEMKNLAELGVDGIFLDGPVMHGCYCPVCRADFKERFGHDIDEATRYELQEMKLITCTEHMKEGYEAVKAINPEVAFYCNASALRADLTGSNTRRLYDYVDIVGSEGGFHAIEMGPMGLWHISSRMKHLEGIVGDTLKGDKPIVDFVNGNHSGIAHYIHTPGETVLSYAQSYANGSNVWYGFHFPAKEAYKTESVLTAKKMNEFVLSNKDIFDASKVCARVALVWSQNTANNYASSVGNSDFVEAQRSPYTDRGDHYVAISSVFDMLVRNHIQFDIIDEDNILNGDIYNYSSVIFPEAACMYDKTAEIIADYVEKGGNILGNLDIGMYNEDGSYNGTSKLAKVFGFASAPEILKSYCIASSYYYKQKEDAFVNGLDNPHIPAPVLQAKWDFADDVEVLMKATRLKTGSYENTPMDGMFPAVTKHKYGKGSAYYISGTYGETAARNRNIIEYGRMVRNFCEATSAPTVQTDAAGLYEVVLRRQENRFILHVVNLTGAMNRPIERVVPLQNVPFKLNLDGFGIDAKDWALKSIRGANVKDLKVKGNEVEFTLDTVNEWEIIVIE